MYPGYPYFNQAPYPMDSMGVPSGVPVPVVPFMNQFQMVNPTAMNNAMYTVNPAAPVYYSNMQPMHGHVQAVQPIMMHGPQMQPSAAQGAQAAHFAIQAPQPAMLFQDQQLYYQHTLGEPPAKTSRLQDSTSRVMFKPQSKQPTFSYVGNERTETFSKEVLLESAVVHAKETAMSSKVVLQQAHHEEPTHNVVREGNKKPMFCESPSKSTEVLPKSAGLRAEETASMSNLNNVVREGNKKTIFWESPSKSTEVLPKSAGLRAKETVSVSFSEALKDNFNEGPTCSYWPAKSSETPTDSNVTNDHGEAETLINVPKESGCNVISVSSTDDECGDNLDKPNKSMKCANLEDVKNRLDKFKKEKEMGIQKRSRLQLPRKNKPGIIESSSEDDDTGVKCVEEEEENAKKTPRKSSPSKGKAKKQEKQNLNRMTKTQLIDLYEKEMKKNAEIKRLNEANGVFEESD